MFKFADNCTDALMLSREAFFGLYDNYNKLEEEAIIQRDTASQAKFERNNAIAKVGQEKDKKIKWRKLAFGEGFIIIGAITGIATGAWVPVAAIVVAAEVLLFLDTKPPKITKSTLFFKP